MLHPYTEPGLSRGHQRRSPYPLLCVSLRPGAEGGKGAMSWEFFEGGAGGNFFAKKFPPASRLHISPHSYFAAATGAGLGGANRFGWNHSFKAGVRQFIRSMA